MEFMHNGETMYVVLDTYSKPKNTSVQLIGPEGPEATLSTNLDMKLLRPQFFFAKTYAENKSIAKSAMDSGLFRDTGERIPSGFVEIEVWEILTFV